MEPLETAEAAGTPTVRQLSVFIENRVGQLMRLTNLLARTDVRILAVSVVYSVDCAICRMILDDADVGLDTLRKAGFPVSDTELIVVSLPRGKRGLLGTWAALLGGEINIHYTYPLLIHPRDCAAIAILPDDLEQAVRILRERSFDVLDEQDLYEAR